MSFSLLSSLAVLGGVAVLATLLWLLQRLRVQHRQVEVLSTLFWQAAMEETRARVFVRRFRHWPAWILLVAIASLLWMLLAGPQLESFDGSHHIVVLDWSVDDEPTRQEDLRRAIEFAETLPPSKREVVAVGDEIEPLLAAGEPVELARLRGNDSTAIGPMGLGWAIESLSARATKNKPVTLYLVGEVELHAWRPESLGDHVRLRCLPRESPLKRIGLSHLGISDAASDRWECVDVGFAFESPSPIQSSDISVTVNNLASTAPLIQSDEQSFRIADVPASGGVLAIRYAGREVGAITLPLQNPIRVSLEDGVPEPLRQLVEVDKACQIVPEGDAEVKIGASEDCQFRLTDLDQPAFFIESDQTDPQRALTELIDILALKQIDATSIADQSGQVVDVRLESTGYRNVAVWSELFSSAYDFQESRACPIFVSRSIRWLANRHARIPWAQQGQRLPVAGREFDRVSGSVANTNDGREIRATRIIENVSDAAELEVAASPNVMSRVGLHSWLGLIVVGLLVCEWVLYQRGRMP